MNDKLIILGTASTLNMTPWDMEGYDYWACAPVITHKVSEGRRIDAIFELHKDSYIDTVIDRLNNYVKKNPEVTVYMRGENDKIKKCIKYPLTEVQSMVNHPRMRSYFTSTIAYMIALAIFKGYKNIEMYGIHMSSTEEEYSLQRECCAAWLAYGWGRGVDFWLPDNSDIMKSNHLYGYEQDNGIMLKAIQFKKNVELGETDLKNKLEDLKERYWQQKGGVSVLDKFIEQLRKEGNI